MTADQFVFWLRGYLAAAGSEGAALTAPILAELGKVCAPPVPVLAPNNDLRRHLDEWEKRRSSTPWQPAPPPVWLQDPPYKATCEGTAK